MDLQRKVSAQAAAIKTLQSENAKSADVNKQLGELIQVASATFRDKSADRKRSSSKPAYRSSSKDNSKKDSDVVMTDMSQAPKVTYTDNTNRADQQGRADNHDEKLQKLKQRLKEEYAKKNQTGNPSNGPKTASRSNSRGRSTTPRPGPNQARSDSASSQKSGGTYSRSASGNNDKEAGVTRVAVDITHKSNFMHCLLCDIKHPPYAELCPATGNQ